jgi:hypothetical protein
VLGKKTFKVMNYSIIEIENFNKFLDYEHIKWNMEHGTWNMEHELKHQREDRSFFRPGPNEYASFMKMHDLAGKTQPDAVSVFF